MEGYWELKTEAGNTRNEWFEIRFMFPNDPSQVLVTNNWSYTDLPFMMISSGTCEVKDNKTFEGKLTAVNAQNPYLKQIVNFKSKNRFRMDFSMLDNEGNEVMGIGVDMIKKGI